MSRPVPIMLIHGFNGYPEGWLPLYEALVARGADPELIRLFHYGWQEGARGEPSPPRPSLAERAGLLGPAAAAGPPPGYNAQADIRQIAARLVRRDTSEPEVMRSQVARLSEASVARGGPARVTIVAHSMGGLVARYYLSQRVPDEWGTVNEGVVGRLITLATPHQGLELARLTALVPDDSIIWPVLRWLERLPFVGGSARAELGQLNAQVAALQAQVWADQMPVVAQGYLDSPAVRQMAAGSAFLNELNQGTNWPADIESALLWGDVRFEVTVRWGTLPLWQRMVTFGDLLIPMASASTLPVAEPSLHPFAWGRAFTIQLGDPGVASFDFADFLPPVAHSNLLLNGEVHATIARLVGLD